MIMDFVQRTGGDFPEMFAAFDGTFSIALGDVGGNAGCRFTQLVHQTKTLIHRE